MSSTIFAITYQTEVILHTDLDISSDTSNASEPQTCAAVGHHSNCQSLCRKESGSKKSLGSRACDPIAILDDDEPEAAKIRYVDVESDDEVSTEGHYMASDKKAAAGAHRVGLQSLAPKSHSPSYINAQGSDPSKHTKTVTQPLFRALTKDDLLAPSAQPLLDSQAVGFKAWYNTHGSHHARKAAPSMQQKEVRQTPSIKLSTKEHTKKAARLDRDRPQFAMNVLRSNRKRTIGELSYNEVISPAQIESPSEKRSRMAKSCRQRQDRGDNRQQNTNGRDMQSALDLDHVQDSKNSGMIGENTELAVPPVMNEALDRRESDAGVSDERNGPVVCKPSPVSTIILTEDQRCRNTTQHCEGHSDEHVEAHHLQSTQTTAQDNDAQERIVSKNTAFSDGSTRRKHGYRKPRVSGTTNACGVFSPEIKPPVKRSSHGEFHCPRCGSQFTRSNGVKYHFEGCIAKYGNLGSLKWNDHPSLRGVEQNIVLTDKKEYMTTVAAPVQATRKDSTSIRHGIVPVGRPTTTTSMVAPLPASHGSAPDRSILSITQSVTEEHASCLDKKPKLGHEALIVEHRATGGKGLSAETLNTYRETGNWDFAIDPNENKDGSQDEEAEVPKIAYQYSVIKREWVETEEDAIESSMGPYYTLDEANAVAKAEVNRPQIDGFEDIHSDGWSYYYREDGNGMQLHMATVLGINIETVVHRSKWLFARTFPE